MRECVFGPLLGVLFCLIACGDDDILADAGADVLLDISAPTDTSPADVGDDAIGLDSAVDSAVTDGHVVDSGGDSGTGDTPNVRGPFTVTVQSAMAGDTPVSACVPEGVRGPLIVFAPGFMIESRFYEPTCQRLASHGFVVLRADPSSGFTTTHSAMRDSLVGVLDWALRDSPFLAQIDPAHILMSGHSLGGKLATMVAAGDARVTALFAIDPVDGGFNAPDVVPSLAMGLTIPVGFAGETTNGSGGFMPCAPSAENFQQFYAATSAAVWSAQWDFTGADHMDFVAAPAGCGFCGVCPAGSADPASVIDGMHTLFVAFARRHLSGDAAMDAWLVGAQVPAGIVTMSR